MTHSEVDQLLTDVAEPARGYISGFGDRPMAPSLEALAGLRAFYEPLPETPSDPANTAALAAARGQQLGQSGLVRASPREGSSVRRSSP